MLPPVSLPWSFKKFSVGLLLVVQPSEAAALILETWLSLDDTGADTGLARGLPGTDAGGNQGSL